MLPPKNGIEVRDILYSFPGRFSFVLLLTDCDLKVKLPEKMVIKCLLCYNFISYHNRAKNIYGRFVYKNFLE